MFELVACVLCLQNSLTRSAPLNSEAQGRSGARFHTSYDKRYVIKTISSEDVAEMHNILKKYHQVKMYFFSEINKFILLFPYDFKSCLKFHEFCFFFCLFYNINKNFLSFFSLCSHVTFRMATFLL